MKDFSKYQGIFPAFYACYDKAGQVSGEASRALARYLLDKGVTHDVGGGKAADGDVGHPLQNPDGIL